MWPADTGGPPEEQRQKQRPRIKPASGVAAIEPKGTARHVRTLETGFHPGVRVETKKIMEQHHKHVWKEKK
jgi:hypothetical protein